MRVSSEQLSFLKHAIHARVPDAEVRLFGSRADDAKYGGDVDILVVGDRRMTVLERVQVKAAFHRAFGMHKIDIASFSRTEASPFRDAVSREAVVI